MTFLMPAALVGLLAAATPVAIYLFLRRRKTEINWGAGYLLRLTLASKKKTSLWRQFVVLAVRTLILALAAMLIAQPFMPGRHPSLDTPALPATPVHRVVLFDNSRSMTVTEANLTRLDRARTAAAALLRSQRVGDTLDLIPLIPEAGSAVAAKTFDGTLSEDATQHALGSVPVRDGLVALEPALAAAMTRLATTPGSTGEVYLLSDFPRELEAQAQRVSWFAQLAKERGVRLAAVNMVGPASDAPQQNVSIDAVTLGTDVLVAGVPSRLYIDASNHSDREAVATFDVSLPAPATAPANSAPTPIKRQVVRLNPDEHKRFAIPLTLTAGNAQVLSVSVTPTLLQSQATRVLSVDVKDALDVWIVSDEKDAADASSEPDDTEFFTRAIKDRKDLAAGVRLHVAKMNDLTLAIPENVDAVILVGPHYTNPAIAAPLAAFVRRGGGLLMTASPTLQVPAFNENLGPLLPAILDKPMHEKIDPETYIGAQVEATVGEVGPDGKPRDVDPLFEEFAPGATAVTGDLAQARFYNHYRVKDADAVPGVVLRLSNGDPLLIEKQMGRGRIFFFTSTLGVGWTSLPVRQSYIPFITRVLAAAVAGRSFPLNLTPVASGASFVASWPAKGSATLTLPDQSTKKVEVLEAAAGQFIVLDNLRDAGLYRLADTAGHHAVFTVVVGASETDLRTLAAPAKVTVAASLGAEIQPDWITAVKNLGPLGASSPLWPWLLAAMLALYVFETWFIKTL
jgi:hypothetical protein